MKTNISNPSASIALALALALALSGTAGTQAQACLDSPAEIQALITEGRIISQYDAVAAAGYRVDDILTYRLCDNGGRYVWIVGVLSADGAAENLTVDAE